MSQIIQWGIPDFAQIAGKSVIPALQRAHNDKFVVASSRHLEQAEDISAAILKVWQTKLGLDEAIRNMEGLSMPYTSLPRS